MNGTFSRLRVALAILAALVLGVPALCAAAPRGGHDASRPASQARASQRGSGPPPEAVRPSPPIRGEEGRLPRVDADIWWSPAWSYGPGPWWGWGWGWWTPPYAYASPYPPYTPRFLRHAGAIELHVHPWTATVSVDGQEDGQARDFNDVYDLLWLRAGDHVVTLTHPRFKTLRVPIHVTAGARYSLRYRLEKGQGLDPRSAAPSRTPHAGSHGKSS